MTFLLFITLICSICGPVALCLNISSRFVYLRLTYAVIACASALMFGVIFGTFFGADILQELFALMTYEVPPA